MLAMIVGAVGGAVRNNTGSSISDTCQAFEDSRNQFNKTKFLSASKGMFKTYLNIAPNTPPWVTTAIFPVACLLARCSIAAEHRLKN